MKNKFFICFLCSVFLLNAFCLPSYALNEGIYPSISEKGSELLLNGSESVSVLIDNNARISPGFAFVGSKILMGLIAGCFINLTHSSLKNIVSGIWESKLSTSSKEFFERTESEVESLGSSSVDIGKDVVVEVVESVNSYIEENKEKILYESTLSGVPLVNFDSTDYFRDYPRSLSVYSLGTEIEVGEVVLGASMINSKLHFLVNGSQGILSTNYKVNDELVGRVYDNRLNGGKIGESPYFYIPFYDMSKDVEGYALCYDTGESMRIFGTFHLNTAPSSVVLPAPDKVIDEDFLVGVGGGVLAGDISIQVPGSYGDIITDAGVLNPPLVDTETGEIVNSGVSSPDVPGGSGGIGVNGTLSFAPVFALGNSLKNVFPFCLPFDLYDIIERLDSEPEVPSFNVDFSFVPGVRKGEAVLSFDLSPLNGVMKMVRSCELICFCIGLILITRKVIS